MRVLLSGAYKPRGTLQYFERAFTNLGQVTYGGLPYQLVRPGCTPDEDLSRLVSQGPWDLFFYVEEWQPVFPQGMERLPFPTAAYFADLAYDLHRRLLMAPFFDYVFLAHRKYVEVFQKIHPHVFWLPFACDPEVHRRGSGEDHLYEVAYVGSAAGERARILAELAKRFRMNDYRKPCNPEEMAKIYSRAKIVFNKPDRGEINMRPFEALSCGAQLVTERNGEGLEEMFEDRQDCVFYNSPAELFGLIRYYLEHEEERLRIAKAGHDRCRVHHTYTHRARSVFEILEKTGYQRCAPARSYSPDQCLLAYARVYSDVIMMDALRWLIVRSPASRAARGKALGFMLWTMGRALRRMGWRNGLLTRAPNQDQPSQL